MGIGFLLYLLLSIDVVVLYVLVLGLMTIESSFIPFPSEIIMIPAGIIAGIAYEGHNVSLFLVIILGVIGSVLGALINYYIGGKIGDKIIKSNKKWMFIKPKHLQKATSYFNKHGSKTIFFSRLIPVIRQYISIPAGASNMKLSKFMIYTALGSTIWVTFLALIGYLLGDYMFNDILNVYSTIVWVILGIIILIIIVKELSR